MRTTQDSAGVCSPALEVADIGERLTGMVLARRAVLPKSANGQPIAPPTQRVKNIRRDMANGRSREWERLLSVDLGDMEQGVPLSMLEAPYHTAIAELREQYARFRRETPKTVGFVALVRAEKKIRSRLDIAELNLVDSPENDQALDAIAREGRAEIKLVEQVVEEAERLKAARPSVRRVVGSRRWLA